MSAELTALSRPRGWIFGKGENFEREREGKESGREKGRKRRGKWEGDIREEKGKEGKGKRGGKGKGGILCSCDFSLGKSLDISVVTTMVVTTAGALFGRGASL